MCHLKKTGRPRRDGNDIRNRDGEGTSKQRKVKLIVKRKKKRNKVGEGSSNQATIEASKMAENIQATKHGQA